MKKKFLRIITLTPEGQFKTVSTFLLTGNVSAYISDCGDTKIYFLNCNPFTFIRVYLGHDEFTRMIRPKHNGTYSTDVKKEGSIFRYELFETE